MLETLSKNFLFTYADRLKKSKGQAITITLVHGLSTWVNETAFRNKIGLAMKNGNRDFEEVLSEIPKLVDSCVKDI